MEEYMQSISSARGLSYIIAGLLFVLSLRGLSTPETARRGNLLGTIGMLIAVLVTVASLLLPGSGVDSAQRSGAPFIEGHAAGVTAASNVVAALLSAIVTGALVGQFLAARVAMTAMPELVAILHSFVGAAAVLVGVASEMEAPAAGLSADVAHQLEIYVGVFVGAVTFTGSVVAFLKLRGTLRSKPLVLPGRHALNLLLVLGSIALGVKGYHEGGDAATIYLSAMTGLSFLLGAHLVLAIGGGDMPVVVSLLNSYSGWAASAAGFMLSNDLLIITGALVGSSGAILSYIMCKAMNRSIWNVVFAGFGESAPAAASKGAVDENRRVTETNVGESAELLVNARSVIIVPGYGMAVAQAQHAVKEITTLLQGRGVEVRYAIHPVAGRLPGHMNVLLAEANVSYEIVKEMEEINEDFGGTDVVVVIGANDIVNPSAQDDPGSPIYGMPVLEAWHASKVIMMKRSMNAGYAGVDNPLCYRDNTLMLFGDAKQTVLKLLSTIRGEA